MFFTILYSHQQGSWTFYTCISLISLLCPFCQWPCHTVSFFFKTHFSPPPLLLLGSTADFASFHWESRSHQTQTYPRIRQCSFIFSIFLFFFLFVTTKETYPLPGMVTPFIWFHPHPQLKDSLPHLFFLFLSHHPYLAEYCLPLKNSPLKNSHHLCGILAKNF